MGFLDLREFIAAVDRLGMLRVVEGAHWELEIGAISQMMQESEENPVLLFDKIPGYPAGFRVLTNHQNNPKKQALVLGIPTELSDLEIARHMKEKRKQTDLIPPREVDSGPILENQERGDKVNILKFPTPKWRTLEGGRYIGTTTLVINRDPDEGWVNMGCYRQMIHDGKSVGFFVEPHHHGMIIAKKYWARGKACPVVACYGQQAELFQAATASAPWGKSELEVAGGMAGHPIEIIKGELTGLPIPARAEIAIEGEVPPPDVEARVEGPYREWPGYYSQEPHPQPVIKIKAVYHRNDPIILGCPPEKPPYEAHRYRVYLSSALLRREIRQAGVPDVTAVWCHGVGGTRLLNVVAIKQRYPGHARQALHVAAMCRAGAYLGRLVIVVDDDIDVTDLDEVMWAVCTRSDPERSLDIIKRAWSGPLDSAIHPAEKGFNSRLLMDACRPYEWLDQFPPAIGPDPAYKRETREKWGWILK